MKEKNKMKVAVNTTSGNGTHLQGSVMTTLARLKELLGKPEYEDHIGWPHEKTTTEWVLEFEDGVVATIYDWKERFQPTEEYDWHIGGKSKVAAHRVEALVSGEENYEIETQK